MPSARALSSTVVLSLAVAVLGAQDRSVSIQPPSASVKVGPYHALLIAEQTYLDETIPQLERPLNDARDLLGVLTSKYQFDKRDVELLVNPTREQIVASLFSLSERLNDSDNLLLFYAGHGFWDERTQQGYWLPSDARRTSPAQWISNADIVDALRRIKTRHTLLISDACFAGGILRTRDAFGDSNGAGILRLYDMPSRKAMTSGSKEVVPDRSQFVEFLVKRLQQNTQAYLPASDVFASLRSAVMNNSSVTPQYGTIFNAGDEGGDFLFPLKPPPPPPAEKPTADVPAAPVPSHGVVWRHANGHYWFYVDGQPRTPDTRDNWIGDNDLLVFDPVAKLYYMLDGFKSRDDGQYRPARLIEAPEISLWRHVETTYWLYQDGKALTGLTSTIVDDDLLVYDSASQQHYVLPGYKKYADGSLHPAVRVGAADRAVGRGLDNGVWLYVDGASVTPVLPMADADNLVVCDSTRMKYYLLENFFKREDGRLRPARPLTLDRSLWRQADEKYSIYVGCVNISSRVKDVWDGDNLLVFDSVAAKYYSLDDYKKRNDGRLRPAREIEAPDRALWKHSGTSFWVVKDGQYITDGLPNAWDGDNLLAYSAAAKEYYFFKDYSKLTDGQLRAARTIEAPDGAVWKHVGDSFWLYVDGKGLSGLTSTWDGDNLIATDPASNRRYLLPDCRHRTDGNFRPASLLR